MKRRVKLIKRKAQNVENNVPRNTDYISSYYHNHDRYADMVEYFSKEIPDFPQRLDKSGKQICEHPAYKKYNHFKDSWKLNIANIAQMIRWDEHNIKRGVLSSFRSIYKIGLELNWCNSIFDNDIIGDYPVEIIPDFVRIVDSETHVRLTIIVPDDVQAPEHFIVTTLKFVDEEGFYAFPKDVCIHVNQTTQCSRGFKFISYYAKFDDKDILESVTKVQSMRFDA